MWQTALNTVTTAALAALVSVAALVIKAFGDAGVQVIQRKKEELESRIGEDAYRQDLAYARSAWNIVDELFRITPSLEKTVEAKQAEFSVQLKKFLPGITDDEIVQLRQAVAGEINRGKAAVTQG